MFKSIAKKRLDLKSIVYTTKNHSGVFTDTLKVAEVFGRRHDNILKIIDRHLKNGSIVLLNVEANSYTTKNNRQAKMYQLDRKAFLVLALSFTGADADRLKGKFVDLFLSQEKELVQFTKVRQLEKARSRPMTDRVKILKANLKEEGSNSDYIYNTINQKIHKRVTGKSMPRGGIDHSELDKDQALKISVLRDCIEDWTETALEATQTAREARELLYEWISRARVIKKDSQYIATRS